MKIARPLLLLCVTLLLSACSHQDRVNMFASESEVEFARAFLENLRNREFDSAVELMDSTLVAEATPDQLEAIAAYFLPGDPLSVETADATLHYRGGQNQLYLAFEYQFSDGWMWAEVTLQKSNGELAVLGFHVQRTEESATATHELDLVGKSFRHYFVLTGSVLVPVFILVSLVVCIRTPIRKRKWLWVVFILLGFVTLRIDWHTGLLTFQPFSLQLLGTGMKAKGPYAPWILGFSLPVGAVLFWIRKKKLVKTEEPPVSSAESDIQAK